jgi:endothelin-converting enzyme/putative endopeptidase
MQLTKVLQLYLKNNPRPELIDGLLLNNAFFISWTTVWRTKSRDEAIKTKN